MERVTPLQITALGRACRQMCRRDRVGFPRTGAKGRRRVQGFPTGDLVRAVLLGGARAGTHVGRGAARARGSFTIGMADGVAPHIAARSCRLLQRADGYADGSARKKGEAALPLTG